MSAAKATGRDERGDDGGIDLSRFVPDAAEGVRDAEGIADAESADAEGITGAGDAGAAERRWGPTGARRWRRASSPPTSR